MLPNMDPRVRRSLLVVLSQIAVALAVWFSTRPAEQVMKEVLFALAVALFWLVSAAGMVLVDVKDQNTYADPVDLWESTIKTPDCPTSPGPRRPRFDSFGHYRVMYALFSVIVLTAVLAGIRLHLSLSPIPGINEVRCLMGIEDVPAAQGQPCKEAGGMSR